MVSSAKQTKLCGRNLAQTSAQLLCPSDLPGLGAEWVYGGLEFDPQQVSVSADGITSKLTANANEPMLGATIQRWFTLGLSRAVTEGVSAASEIDGRPIRSLEWDLVCAR